MPTIALGFMSVAKNLYCKAYPDEKGIETLL